MTRWLLLAAGVLALSISVDAQRRLRGCCQTPGGGGGGGGVGILARLNCDAPNSYPTCGAIEVNAAENGTEYQKSNAGAVGPQGQTAIHWIQAGIGTGEKYFGNAFDGMPTITQGHRVYIRFMIRGTSPLQTGSFGDKIVILGDDDPHPDDQRIIITLRQGNCSGSSNCYWMDADRNIDGLDIGMSLVAAEQDTWIPVQWEIDTSTTTSSGDGCLKFWENNDTYASPNDSVCSQNFTAGYAGRLGFGYFGPMNEGGPHAEYDVCCFEYASSGADDNSAFDSNWTNGGSFWARSLRPDDAWRLALQRMLPWQGFSRATRGLALRTR